MIRWLKTFKINVYQICQQISSKISDHWVDNHYGKKENICDIEVQHSCNENHFVY
jgi:hypothetical protein